MKAPLSILLLLSGLCQNLTAQQPVFFPVVDSACMPHTPNLSSPYVLNNALSYNWNFGNGTTSTANSPFISYATAGTYRLSLTVTTNATDKIVNQLTIAAIPNTWDDGLFTDPLPDLYYLVKNELGVIVFISPVMFDKVPPVVFTNGFLMKADKNYTVELWEYDLIGSNDFLSYIPLPNSPSNGTFSANGGTITFTTMTGNTSYTYAKNIRILPPLATTISYVKPILTANTGDFNPSSVRFQWYKDNLALSPTVGGMSRTLTASTNGTYKVLVTTGLTGCSNVSANFVVTNITTPTLDVSVLQTARVYPTPSVLGETKWLSVQTEQARTVELIVAEVSGRVVSRQNISLKTGDNTVELPKFTAAGTYAVHLTGEGRTVFNALTIVH